MADRRLSRTNTLIEDHQVEVERIHPRPTLPLSTVNTETVEMHPPIARQFAPDATAQDTPLLTASGLPLVPLSLPPPALLVSPTPITAKHPRPRCSLLAKTGCSIQFVLRGRAVTLLRFPWGLILTVGTPPPALINILPSMEYLYLLATHPNRGSQKTVNDTIKKNRVAETAGIGVAAERKKGEGIHEIERAQGAKAVVIAPGGTSNFSLLWDFCLILEATAPLTENSTEPCKYNRTKKSIQ